MDIVLESFKTLSLLYHAQQTVLAKTLTHKIHVRNKSTDPSLLQYHIIATTQWVKWLRLESGYHTVS